MVICYAVSLAWRDSFSSGSLAVCLASYSKDPYELNEDEGNQVSLLHYGFAAYSG